MSKLTLFFLLAGLMAIIAVASANKGKMHHGGERHHGRYRDHYKGMRKCHKAMRENLHGEVEKDIDHCKQYKNGDCFFACFAVQRGYIKDNKFQEDVWKSKFSKHLDDKHPEKDSTLKTLHEKTLKCYSDYAKSGKSWPTDFNGECPEVNALHDCIIESRKC